MTYPPPQAPFYYGAPPPRQSSGVSAGGILVLFVGVLLILTLVGAVYVLLSQPLPPAPPCEPGQVCAPQPSLPPVAGQSPAPTRSGSSPAPNNGSPSPVGSPAAPTPPSRAQLIVAGEVWQSATLGYSFEYDPGKFQVSQSSDDLVVFDVAFADAQIVVVGASGDMSPSQLIQRELSTDIDSFVIGRTLDKDPYDQLLGPSIGYIRGEGAVYSGTIIGSDGTPVAPGGITILASTDGRITAAVIVVVAQPDVLIGPDTLQYKVRQAADEFLKTFNWGPT